MWLVAEKSDAKAIEDFGVRFPQYRSELGKRLALVRNLRGAKAQHLPPAVKPAFHVPIRITPSPAKFFGMGIAVGVAAISVASYYVFASRGHAAAPIAGPVVETTSRPQMSKPGPATPKQNLFLPKEYRYKEIPQVDTRHDPALDHMPIEYGPAAAQAHPEKGKDVDIRKAPLMTVLLMIAESNKIKLTLAPNLPNPDVTVSYKSMGAKAMIRDLTSKYGIVAMDEGENSMILMPKSSAPPETSTAPESSKTEAVTTPAASKNALPNVLAEKPS